MGDQSWVFVQWNIRSGLVYLAIMFGKEIHWLWQLTLKEKWDFCTYRGNVHVREMFIWKKSETVAVEGEIEIWHCPSQWETPCVTTVWHFHPTLHVEASGNKPHLPSERTGRAGPLLASDAAHTYDTGNKQHTKALRKHACGKKKSAHNNLLQTISSLSIICCKFAGTGSSMLLGAVIGRFGHMQRLKYSFYLIHTHAQILFY